MTPAEIWAELGIPPSADRASIRRAYAARLKATPPEGDPHGFARLRDAYERALQAAEAPSTRPESAPTPAPAPLPRPAPPLPQVDGVADALQRRDVAAAADWLLAARPGLALADDMRFTDHLGWAMAQDRTLPAQAVQEAAERLGWQQDGGPGPWARTLRARLEAEQWLATLRRDAASGTRFLGGAKSLAARILLGRGGMRALAIMGNDRTLRRRYGEYLLHAAVIEDGFDPARIAAVGRALTGRPDKPKSVFLTLFGLILLAWAIGFLAGQIDPTLQDGTTGLVACGLMLALFGKGQLQRIRAARQRAADIKPPRAVRLAFWLSLAVTGAGLGAIALLGSLSLMGLETQDADTSSMLEGFALLLAFIAAPCLVASRSLARRGWNIAAIVAATVPVLYLLLTVFALLNGSHLGSAAIPA